MKDFGGSIMGEQSSIFDEYTILIETLTIAIPQNVNIKGIPIEDN